MPNYKDLMAEIRKTQPLEDQTPLDVVRRKYLKKIYDHNGNRNVIAYYSGWLQKPNLAGSNINDKDMSGFMLGVHGLDKNKGLDLILHTPGGDLTATESIITYLKKFFGNDIRAIVPQLSMSAGTMIALSCKEILMGKQSSLGPIDPSIGGMQCESVVSEFERARKEILENSENAYLWEFILSKYYPTFLNSCQYAIDLSGQLAKQWLKENMCKDDHKLARKICDHFSSHKKSKTHARHLSADTCKEIGVKIVDIEESQDLQDAILTTHHAFMESFSRTTNLKIIENHCGVALIESLPIQMPFPQR